MEEEGKTVNFAMRTREHEMFGGTGEEIKPLTNTEIS